jgi:predicted ATP-dependent serine protease
MHKMAFVNPSTLAAQEAVQSGHSGKYSGFIPSPKSKWEWRVNPVVRKPVRMPTNISTLDTYFGGGLPKGLSIIWGDSGSGKSLMARQIAQNQAKGPVLYLCCEVLSDAPDKEKYPMITIVDYTRMRPSYKNAVSDLFGMIDHFNPSLVVIDSLTSFLGVTNKALPESSIREAVWDIHLNSEGLCPIVGTSEVRGSGWNKSTAGGEAVKHGCSMLVYAYKHFLVREAQLYGFPTHSLGDVVYTVEVQKDKHGVACNRPYEVVFDDEYQYRLVDPRPKEMK